jgi:predicted dehydrogenase
MDISRRNFFYRASALSAASCLIPFLPLTSCNPAGKTDHIRLGFVGSEDHFRYYKPFFQGLKKTTVDMTSFDLALKSDNHAIFIDSYPSIKAAQIVLLLEENKDIITPYPLASSLHEYSRIQEFLERYGRRLGLLNPLYFYPAVRTLKDFLAEKNHNLSTIRISCHPEQLVKDYPVNGATGTVAPLQRIISYISGKFPFSLFIEKEETSEIQRWYLDYKSFQASIRVDPGQTGWIMELEGPQLNALTDHTGLLRMNDEVEPRISPTPSVWTRSMTRNLQDFLQAVRLRTEPMVNSLDGLSAIILHQAAVTTLHSGTKVNL